MKKKFISLMMMCLTCLLMISFHFNEVDAATLKMTSMNVSATSTYVNTSIKITANSSGGSGTKKYKYYYKYNGKTTTIKNYSTSKSSTFKPTKNGTYTVYVTVKDGKNKTATKSKTVKVYNTLKVSSFTTSVSSTYVNNTIKLTGASTGGIGTKNYKFYYKLNGTTTTIKNYSTSKSVSFKPTKAGTYTFYVAVKDNKKTVTKSKTVTVYAAVNGTLSFNNYVKTNTGVKMTATGSGGKGTKNYKFVVYKNGSAIKTQNYSTTKTFTYKPTSKGTYTVKMTVRDANKKTKTISKNLYVYSTALSATLSYDKSPIFYDDVTIKVTGKNGVGTLKYKFTDENNKTIQDYSTNNSYTFTANEIKTYTYYAYVKDEGGKVLKYTVNSTVQTPTLSVEDMNLTVGTMANVDIVSNTPYDSWTYTIEDESICNIDRNYHNVMPLHEGSTNVTLTIKYKGVKLASKTFKVNVTGNDNVKIIADLSKWNSVSIKELKDNGVDGVILRVGTGSDGWSEQDDPMFEEYVNQCKEVGMEFGVYLYSFVNDSTNEKDGLPKYISEANHIHRMLQYVEEAGASEYFTLPIYYD